MMLKNSDDFTRFGPISIDDSLTGCKFLERSRGNRSNYRGLLAYNWSNSWSNHFIIRDWHATARVFDKDHL
jgi:hypothetical protein